MEIALCRDVTQILNELHFKPGRINKIDIFAKRLCGARFGNGIKVIGHISKSVGKVAKRGGINVSTWIFTSSKG
ncbi:hypothetical protein HVA01_29570 [Halovibrio variabilis]|uniref:Uncharacterized protein n=1 Tax=Halovibrio variabilis TaxID=31910 RepID=A0A511UTN6_9GAMM|nr:hypothetical protein HVA01_29570 [Halovibrio variabilis]